MSQQELRLKNEELRSKERTTQKKDSKVYGCLPLCRYPATPQHSIHFLRRRNLNHKVKILPKQLSRNG